MIGASLITVERLDGGKFRAQRPNHTELNANRLFSIYYFFNQLLCCLLKKSQVLFSPTRDGAVRSLISRHPHHIAAAACVYLCSCVQWVHNLSIYVCVSVCVRESTAQDALRLSEFQPPVHTHAPHHWPQITSRIWILGKAQDLQKVPTVGGCMITSRRLHKKALSFTKQQ